jgi:hypothetical protein
MSQLTDDSLYRYVERSQQFCIPNTKSKISNKLLSFM